MKHDLHTMQYIDQKTEQKFEFPLWVFKKPNNDKEYKRLEKILDDLIDKIRDDSKHPLTAIMQMIGQNLEQYDNENNPPIGHDVNDIEVVKYLMKSQSLFQKDLADIFGSQANVSKYLNGERPLSKNQIIGLKKRFGISADFFIR